MSFCNFGTWATARLPKVFKLVVREFAFADVARILPSASAVVMRPYVSGPAGVRPSSAP